MKCNNCNKEILDNLQNYCTHCGETLNHNNEVKNIGSINNGLTEEQIENAKEQLGNAKEVLAKNKKAVGIVAGVITLLAVVIGIFVFMSGRPMSESKIKDSLIGQSVNFGRSNVDITEDNLKSIKIISRNTVKKFSDKVELEMELDLDEATVVIIYSANYVYNDKWEFSSGRINDLKSVNPTSKPDDKIEELIKKNGIRFKTAGAVKGDLVKELSSIKVSGEGESRTFTSDILLSNGVISQKGKVEGKVEFNLSDFTWSTSDVYITSSEDVKLEEKIDEDALKKILISAIGGNESGKAYNYEFKVGENTRISTFNITKDMITDLTIKNPSYIEAEKHVRLEVEGKAKSDLLKELSLSGVVLLNSSFDKSILKSSDIDITSASVEEATLDKVKELILDKKIDNSKITTDVAKSFVEESRNVSEITREYINGKITVDGKDISVQVQLQLTLNEGKHVWKVNGIYKEDSFVFKKFE